MDRDGHGARATVTGFGGPLSSASVPPFGLVGGGLRPAPEKEDQEAAEVGRVANRTAGRVLCGPRLGRAAHRSLKRARFVKQHPTEK